MRVVITGPTGSIGHAMIENCIDRGIEVLAICHRGSKRSDSLPKSELVSILELDLDDYKNAADLELLQNKQYDIFYHLAWNATIGDGRNDMDLQHSNVGYALDACRLAKALGCKTFVGAGSQAEYGRFEGKLTAETPARPEMGYGIAKLCAGQMTRILCDQLGMNHIWVRILSIYGPYDGEKTMISTVIKELLNGEVPALTKGEQMWDYLYSGDAGRAVLLAGEKGIAGKTYVIGSGEVKPLREYVEILRDAIDPKLDLGIGKLPYRDKQVMYLQADISELTKDTGFVPEVSFEEGIRKTIEFVKNSI